MFLWGEGVYSHAKHSKPPHTNALVHLAALPVQQIKHAWEHCRAPGLGGHRAHIPAPSEQPGCLQTPSCPSSQAQGFSTGQLAVVRNPSKTLLRTSQRGFPCASAWESSPALLNFLLQTCLRVRGWGSIKPIWQSLIHTSKHFSTPGYEEYQHICIKIIISKVKSSKTVWMGL